MITAAALDRKLKKVESGPSSKDRKYFFVNVGEGDAFTASQMKKVRVWENSHPWASVYIIYFLEVTAHYPEKENS